LKIIFNKDLSGFKINITDKSGLRLVNIFKSEDQKIIQQKFYFLMDSLVERDIFEKTPLAATLSFDELAAIPASVSPDFLSLAFAITSFKEEKL